MLAHQRALVLRAQSGDRDAFDALLRDVAPPLLRYVERVVGEKALARNNAASESHSIFRTMPIVLGLVALGAHVNRCTLRVLARLDEVSPSPGLRPPSPR